MYISNQMSTPMQMTGELDAERIGGIIYKHASFRAFTRGQLRKSGIHRVLNRLDRVVAAVCKEFSLNPGSSLYLAVFSNTRCNELYYFLIYDDSCGTHQAKYSILNCSGKYIPLMPYGPWLVWNGTKRFGYNASSWKTSLRILDTHTKYLLSMG
eukprot:528105_1